MVPLVGYCDTLVPAQSNRKLLQEAKKIFFFLQEAVTRGLFSVGSVKLKT